MFCRNYIEVLGHKCEVQFYQEGVDYSSYDIVIVCALDDEYVEIVDKVNLKDSQVKMMAGKKYQHSGFQNIYMGQDIYKVLFEVVKSLCEEEK